MSIRLAFDGLKEFVTELEQLPAEIRAEAAAIANEAAQGAARAVAATYPPGKTGNLRRGLRVDHPAPGVAVVRNVSPHAWIFEHGTKQRHTGSTRIRSKGREVGRRSTGGRAMNRGKMPAADERFVGIVLFRRRRMQEQLMAMLQHHGFTVTEG